MPLACIQPQDRSHLPSLGQVAEAMHFMCRLQCMALTNCCALPPSPPLESHCGTNRCIEAWSPPNARQHFRAFNLAMVPARVTCMPVVDGMLCVSEVVKLKLSNCLRGSRSCSSRRRLDRSFKTGDARRMR